MAILDGSRQIFSAMPGYADMNPCAKDCDYDTGFNGCDIAKCWCNSGNLNLRMSSLGVCFSSSCTFSFMNTATDLTTLSYIQIEYCSKKGLTNLPGLSVPSTATPMVTSGAAATSEAAAASSAVVLTTAIITSGQTFLTAVTLPSHPTASSQSSPSSSGLSTGARTGISIGVAVAGLLGLLFIALLLLRRKRHTPPPTMQPYPGPYTPQSPPQLRAPPPAQPMNPQMAAVGATVVSPIEEKQYFQRKPISRSASQVTPVSPAVSAAGMQIQYSQQPPPMPVGQEMDASEAVRRNELENSGLPRNELESSGLPRSELPAYQRDVGGLHELGPGRG